MVLGYFFCNDSPIVGDRIYYVPEIPFDANLEAIITLYQTIPKTQQVLDLKLQL